MVNDPLIAQAIFASYFLLIIGLFVLILRSQSHKFRTAFTFKDPDVVLFTFLTLGSFAHTWFYMFKFMAWSFASYEAQLSDRGLSQTLGTRLTAWLMHTDLFEQAWGYVCEGTMNWWWSEQLCLFTVGFWTVLLVTKGQEYSIQHIWAYMLLGQVVAISVASNLFYLVLVLSRRGSKRTAQPVSITLWAAVLVSLATVVYSPYTSKQGFLPNLLIMHALLLVPLLPRPRWWRTPIGPSHTLLYTTVAVVSVLIRCRTTMIALRNLPSAEQNLSGFARQAWVTLHVHPAQASIGWDVVWTTVSFLVWSFVAPLSRRPPNLSNKSRPRGKSHHRG